MFIARTDVQMKIGIYINKLIDINHIFYVCWLPAVAECIKLHLIISLHTGGVYNHGTISCIDVKPMELIDKGMWNH